MVKKKSQFTNDDMQAQGMNLSMKARVYQCFPVVSGDTIFPMSLEFLLLLFVVFFVLFFLSVINVKFHVVGRRSALFSSKNIFQRDAALLSAGRMFTWARVKFRSEVYKR